MHFEQFGSVLKITYHALLKVKHIHYVGRNVSIESSHNRIQIHHKIIKITQSERHLHNISIYIFLSNSPLVQRRGPHV